MHRPTRLSLVIAVLTLIVALGGYTAFWFIVAGKIEQGLAEWAEGAGAQKIAASWQGLRVGGFPFAFDIKVTQAMFRDQAIKPVHENRQPLLAASCVPRHF